MTRDFVLASCFPTINCTNHMTIELDQKFLPMEFRCALSIDAVRRDQCSTTIIADRVACVVIARHNVNWRLTVAKHHHAIRSFVTLNFCKHLVNKKPPTSVRHHLTTALNR
ncbi:hypothetical protein D3C78_1412280 [compost metagenome]